MATRRALFWHYTDDALDDLDAVADYYASLEAWEAALDVPDRIRAQVPMISANPRAWPVGVSGYRECFLTDLPFRVVFDISANAVIILRIKHTRQMWP
jgi:plasmid stabilization system protein ParE